MVPVSAFVHKYRAGFSVSGTCFCTSTGLDSLLPVPVFVQEWAGQGLILLTGPSSTCVCKSTGLDSLSPVPAFVQAQGLIPSLQYLLLYKYRAWFSPQVLQYLRIPEQIQGLILFTGFSSTCLH